MKLAYVSIFDARDVRNWSGTLLHIWQALEAQGIEIEIIDNLRHGPSLRRKLRKLRGRCLERREFLHFWDVDTARDYASDVAARLQGTNADMVLSASPVPLAYLNCPQPKILWTDASFAALSRDYEEFKPERLCKATVANARAIDCAVGQNCALLLFASDWGAEWAIRETAVDVRKVAVIPYGANFEVKHGIDTVRRLAADKPRDKIEFLFVGVDWQRKGAAKAISVVEGLRARGFDAHLTLVGCSPPSGETVPPFVHLRGFISKTTQEGRSQINDLYRSSHFLIVPTIAEAYGLVFAEASAFGVPSLSHAIGGVTTVVHNDVNGRLFALDQPVSDWVDWAADVLQSPERYRRLAEASYREYEARLNWNVAGRHAAAAIHRVTALHQARMAASHPSKTA